MLPGISAEDCLFAELGVDPARNGRQSFEATSFLIRRRAFAPHSALILWQIGAIGERSVSRNVNWHGLRLLIRKLQQQYPFDHEVIVYEAAFSRRFPSFVKRTPLSELDKVSFSPMATLYVPATAPAPRDEEALAALEWKNPECLDKGDCA